MDNKTFFDSNMGNLFVQPDGPNTAIYPLGCHDLGDISESMGEITERRCPNPASPGKWEVVLSSVGVPDRGTTSITTYLGKVKDWLERQGNDAFTLYVHNAHEGRKDLFMNYERGEVMRGCRLTSKTRSNMVTREGAEAAEQSFEMSFDGAQAYYPLTMTEEATSETKPLLSICVDSDTGVGVIGCAAAAGAAAHVLYRSSEDSAWAATAAAPFAADQDVAAVALIPISRTVWRILAARGTTVVGAPLTVAYSDNWGTAWTTVSVGGANANFAVGPKSLFALDYANIYIVGDDGDIFKSVDGGSSWEEIPTTNANALRSVYFHDTNTGIVTGGSNTILRTVNAGTSWATISGPAAQAAAYAMAALIFDEYRMMVGYDDGEVWYTDDAGSSWAQVSFSLPTGFVSGSVVDMHCVDDHLVALALSWKDSGGSFYGTYYRTFCGGTYWEYWNSEDYVADGATSIWVSEYDKLHGIGGVIAGAGTIYLISD